MPPRYPVPDLEERTEPRFQIHMQRDPGDIDWGGRTRPVDFEVTYLRFEGDTFEDNAWEFQHLLGRGGFGLVGLWSKKDEEGNIIDNLAVKEMPMPTESMYAISDNTHPLPDEIIIQTALQKKNCVPVLQARGLSILTAPPGHREKLRYYLEYCPHGDLDGVMQKYHHRLLENPNSVENVPEPFLWQLLFSFTEVMKAMEDSPFDHPNNNLVGDNPYILHLDLKLPNVMLHDPDDQEMVQGYPSCKVGDWGLAKLTSLTDARNSRNWWESGTRCWFPPEQFRRNQFGMQWHEPPPWRTGTRGMSQSDHAYTTKHSVFAFASIIFRLMVIDIDYTRLESLIELGNRQEHFVRLRNWRFVEAREMDTNTHGRPTRYTPLLKDTISNCLNFNPGLRPPIDYLNLLAGDMCRSYATQQFQDGISAFPALLIRAQNPDNTIFGW